MRFIRSAQSILSVIVLTATFVCASAQQPQVATPSLNAEQDARQLMLHADRIAIVDGGTDNRWPAENANYMAIFAQALQLWGRYQIVADPATADAVLVVSGGSSVYSGFTTDSSNDTVPYTNVVPYLRVGIRRPDGSTPLWTITTPAFSGTWHRRDLLALSAGNLVSNLKTFEGVPLTRAEISDLTWQQRRYHHALAWMIGGFSAAAAGGAIAFVVSRHHMEQNQHNFCVTNGIPGC